MRGSGTNGGGKSCPNPIGLVMLALNFHRSSYLGSGIFTCIPTHPPGGSSKQLNHGLQHRSHDMTPSRCPNCGFASLLLDPFLLSRMRVGVWDTSTHGLQHRSHGMTPSRCPNCGFASLFLDPFLLSRTRVGVWDTSTFSCKSISGAMEMAGEPPLFQATGRTVRHFPTAAPPAPA